MASEKADLPTDQVSLPPTYAPSETYTESPPPAYRKPGMAAVKVARVVCFTILAMTLVIGFFVITHKWIQTRECNCQQESLGTIQHAALLAKAPNFPNSDLDNSIIEENIVAQEGEGKAVFGDASRIMEDERVSPEQVNEIVEDDKEDQQGEDEFEELNKNVQLPKDILLGNPQLAGRNVHCKVEKRQRRIAEGIMSQAIIVTCDDDDDETEGPGDGVIGQPPMSLIPVRPPMSLLSTIMKVLSAHPPSLENEPEEQPQRLPFPIEAFPRPMPEPMRGPFPFIRPVERPFPGSFPGPMSPVLVPVRKIEIGKPFHINGGEESEEPDSFQHPSSLIEEARFPHMHGMAPPLQFIRRPAEDSMRDLPFPLPPRAFPVRVIRISPRHNGIPEENQSVHEIPEEAEDNEESFPLPIHPFMRLFPQGRRIIRLNPKPTMEDSQNEPLSFPIPRGALPPPPPMELPVPHPMPEASGRALPAPVALPQGVRVVRLPFRPPPQIFPEAKLITHMEVRQPQGEESQSQDPQNELHRLQNVQENRSFNPNSKEFGPPKTHTVIESVPPLPLSEEYPQEIRVPEFIERDSITQSQSQPKFLSPPPPPPPRYASEGRTSFQAELNPDAEVIPQNPNLEAPHQIHRIVLN